MFLLHNFPSKLNHTTWQRPSKSLTFFDIWQGVRSRSCLSAERRHFSSPRKKHFYFTKSFPNGIIGCVERGFYKKITRSPVSGDQVIRCCSDLMFPPKRDFILKKSLFLDGVHVQMINLFIKKFTHRLSALPQPYCSLSRWDFSFSSGVLSLLNSPLFDFLPAFFLAPPCFAFFGGIWNSHWANGGFTLELLIYHFNWKARKTIIITINWSFANLPIWVHFVHFSSSPSRSTRTPWNE